MSAQPDREQQYQLELVACPECGGLAEVVARFTLGSSDGPLEHLKVSCVARHGFVLPADRVTSWSLVDEPQRQGARLRREHD
jgi:hypothetical protein